MLSAGNTRLIIGHQSSFDAAKAAGPLIDHAQAAIAAYQTVARDAQKQKSRVMATDADVMKTAQDIMT